jgi:hypothetical protein
MKSHLSVLEPTISNVKRGVTLQERIDALRNLFIKLITTGFVLILSCLYNESATAIFTSAPTDLYRIATKKWPLLLDGK